jgi:uncharacterized membrane protein
MKTGMFRNIRLPQYDVYSLLVFFAGTTYSLFSKKYYLSDGFKPVFYAALFGFMLSLVFRTILKRNSIVNEEQPKQSFRQVVLQTFFISLFDFVLLCLALFIVWYISRLQGIIVLDNVSFWPSALLLCICLGACYSVYSYMEDRFNSGSVG